MPQNPRDISFSHPTPGWSAEGVAPSDEFKQEGYKAGYKPPAGFFNWFWTLVSQNLEELQEVMARYATANEADKATISADLAKKLDATRFTAAEMRTRLNSEPGLNADMVDGVHATGFATAGHTHAAATSAANGLMSAADKKNLDAHIANRSNPHGVTAAQLGAFSVNGGTINGYTTVNNTFVINGQLAVNGNNPFTLNNGLCGFRSTDALNIISFCDSLHVKSRNMSVYMPVYASAFSTSSSRRFKENIRTLREAEAERVLKLAPKAFTMKGDEKGALKYGLIAEEVAEIDEALVSRDEDGKPLAIDYTMLVAPLVAVVQRQQAAIAALEERIKTLEVQNAEHEQDR